jgi:hypothetical protein
MRPPTGRWGNRLATRGEGRDAAPDGEYAYLELEVHELNAALVQGSLGPR